MGHTVWQGVSHGYRGMGKIMVARRQRGLQWAEFQIGSGSRNDLSAARTGSPGELVGEIVPNQGSIGEDH
jgi:hypothetical protein